jgi:hypothetical protein
MARLVPSLVARAIEFTYPAAADDATTGGTSFGSLEQDQSPQVAMILGLAERIPPELLPTDAKDLTVLVAACGAMRGALMSWSGGGHPNYNAKLSPSAVFGWKSPVVALLRILRSCEDEGATSATAGLFAIADPTAREDIRVDMSNAHRALGNGEFKAATVLAGAVVEALLLWAIKQRDPAEVDAAVVYAVDNAKKMGKKAPDKRGPEFWHLPELIVVAERLDVIDSPTAIGATLAGEFRNLIHPGRVLRTGSRCDQATALTTMGVMERIAAAI